MQHPPTQTSCYLFRSLPTILLPTTIPPHTQTSRSSLLPFKPIRLLHAPPCSAPRRLPSPLRAPLCSTPSSNRQPFLSVAFHHLSGANLAAPSDTNLLLFASVSTDYFAPLPIPLHTQTSRSSLLPFKPIRLLCAPLAAHPRRLPSPLCAPLAALSGSRRLRSTLPFAAPSGNRQPPTALLSQPSIALAA